MSSIRKLALAAGIAVASTVAFAAPASAQTFGGLTLSFGSGGYGSSYGYDDDERYPSDAYVYRAPQYQPYYQYQQPDHRWQDWQQRQQIQRWRAEQQRRLYWERARRERQQWRYDGDDYGY